MTEEGDDTKLDHDSTDDHYTDDGYGSNAEYDRFVTNNGSYEDHSDDNNEYYDDDSARDNMELRLDLNDFQDDYVDVDSSDMSDSEKFLPRAPYIPENHVVDTKIASGSLRKNGLLMMSDQLGTGDLLDDETSAVALVAVFGLLAVIVVLSFLSSSWNRTMDSLPMSKKSSSRSKQDAPKISTSPLLKRRDRTQ